MVLCQNSPRCAIYTKFAIKLSCLVGTSLVTSIAFFSLYGAVKEPIEGWNQKEKGNSILDKFQQYVSDFFLDWGPTLAATLFTSLIIFGLRNAKSDFNERLDEWIGGVPLDGPAHVVQAIAQGAANAVEGANPDFSIVLGAQGRDPQEIV